MSNLQSRTISCQLSFYPLGTADHLKAIEGVLAIIQNASVSSTVSDMSTIMMGASSDIFALLEKITLKMDDAGCKFAMNLTISNTCGID